MMMREGPWRDNKNSFHRRNFIGFISFGYSTANRQQVIFEWKNCVCISMGHCDDGRYKWNIKQLLCSESFFGNFEPSIRFGFCFCFVPSFPSLFNHALYFWCKVLPSFYIPFYDLEHFCAVVKFVHNLLRDGTNSIWLSLAILLIWRVSRWFNEWTKLNCDNRATHKLV